MSDSDKKKNSGKIDEDLVRNLANLLTETDISEIEIEQNGLRLRVARQMSGVVAVAPAAVAASGVAPASAPASIAAAAPVVIESADLANHPGAVTSPMVGTIYTSPDPDSAVFINVGDQVSEGQTVMIVEAMKTMNNIPATKAGRVAQILVTNEQPIEFGEVLIVIE